MSDEEFWGIVAFQFIPKVFSGIEVRALYRPHEFFNSRLTETYLYGAHIVHRGTVPVKENDKAI